LILFITVEVEGDEESGAGAGMVDCGSPAALRPSGSRGIERFGVPLTPILVLLSF
jgi:hypothetical protein